MSTFRWNDWNLEAATKHFRESVDDVVEEIEAVVRREMRARRAHRDQDEKWRVEGRGTGNRVIEVIYLLDDKQASDEDSIYVIHAMPLTTRRRRN